MLYNLQGTKTNVLDVRAGENLKRGQLVELDVSATQSAGGVRVVKKAVNQSSKVLGIVTRGVKVTDAVASGASESEMSVDQDVIVKGEMCGVYPLVVGSVFASTCIASSEESNLKTIGTCVMAKAGDLAKEDSTTDSALISEGVMEVAGNKCVVFRVIK